MRRIKYLIIMCMLLLFGITKTDAVYAQEESFDKELEVSLNRSVDMAIEASEELKLKDNMIKRRLSEKKEEKADIFPHVSGELGWSNNFEYPDIVATSATKKYHLDTGVSVSQILFTFGRVFNSILAAQKSLEASQSDRQSSKREIIYNAKIAFYQASLTKNILRIARESYENTLKNKDILQERVSGGRSSEYDNIKISSDIASRKPIVNNAHAEFSSAMETFKRLIGVEADSHVTLIHEVEQEYPDFYRDELVLALYNNHPDIKTLELNIEEKGLMVKSKKAALFPEVSAFATWNHKGDSNDYYVGDDYLNDYGVAGLRINVPIWMGGENHEQLYQAKIDKSDAELKCRQGKKEYLLMLDKALNEYREYKKTLDANKEALRLAEEAFRYSQELFSSGRVSVTDLNDAELQLTNAKINKEMTLFNLNVTLALLERLTEPEQRNE